MAHGHSNRAPSESALDRALARASGTWGGYQAWHQLDPQERLELVEQALGCGPNDLANCFPAAL